MILNLFKCAFACLILLLFNVNQAICQVVINEIAPSNISLLQNANGEFNDWIELYNSGDSSVNLSGYGLTDDATSPYRFTFMSEVLPPGGRLLVFASDSNSDVLVNHYEMAVNANSAWKYKLGSSELDTNWRNISFNDNSWSSGNGGIGFSDGDDGTTIPTTVSVMMRKTFVADTSKILTAILRMDYDDGFVAYLNGVEIARSNMHGSKRPAWNELAIIAHEAQMYHGLLPDSFYIDHTLLKSLLKNGPNVLAIETHDAFSVQTDLSSIPFLFFGMRDSTITYASPPAWFIQPEKGNYNAEFKLNNTGETVYFFNAIGNIVDQKTYPSIANDNVYARNPDGGNTWCYQKISTPLASNNTSQCYQGYATPPVFSVQSGFYNLSKTVSLSTSMPGAKIRYTVNGDIPNDSSLVYSLPLIIDSTITIRASVLTSGYLESPVITNTYFINEEIHLPVFSITTDSLNLWDYNTGIYVLGPNADTVSPFFGANFWEDWTKPASIEYFDKLKNRVLSFDADIQIYGNYSRQKPQKSFEIELSDKYGINEVNYPFIPDKSFITKYDKLILRNAGTDWNIVHFRDALMQRLMKNTYSDYIAAEPVVLFLNGEFWGVYMFNEKHNQNWVEANYGYKKEEINFLVEVGSEMLVTLGSGNSFDELYEYAISESPSTNQYYDVINNKLDLQNFADYFIAETYYDNGDWIGDWTNNIKLWQPRKQNAKWKYILLDLDYGFGLKGNVNDNRLRMARDPVEFSSSSDIFDAVLKNPTFKNYFINRYADLINTTYLPTNVEEVMKQFRDSMAFDMNAHFAKWGEDTAFWNSRISSMMSFVNQRPAISRNYIRQEFGLVNNVKLTVNTFPPGSGRIEISTIIPHTYPWTGIYFNGNPVTVTAIPNPGFIFDHWTSAIISPNDSSQRTTYNFNTDDTITAYFSGSPAIAKLTISEINYNSFTELRTDDWIELNNYGAKPLDISEWKLSDEEDRNSFVFPTGTVIPAGGYIVVPEDTQKFKEIFPGVSNRIGQLSFSLGNNGEEIRIFDYNNSLYKSFSYDDQLPWPVKADGGGFTCELLDPSGNLNSGNNWYAGCFGGSPGSAHSSHLATPVSISGDSIICEVGSVKLNATPISLYNYQWILNNDYIDGANTDSLETNIQGMYNVFVNVDGCTTVSSPINLTKRKNEPEPIVTPGARCNSGPVALSASGTDSIYWYNSPSGSLVFIGETFITPSLTNTTTYYARNGSICPSDEVPAVATITGVCDELISLYPNPVTGNSFKIESDELTSGDANLIVSNISGQIIKNFVIPISSLGKSGEIRIDEMNFGIYFLSVYQNEKFLVTKLIKL